MNTEPPTGDDLNRLLVSMKQNVLERATDRPPRPRRRHVGLIIGFVALLGLGSASGAVALGLVPHPFAAREPAAPITSSAPQPTSAPTSTTTPEPVVTESTPPPVAFASSCKTIVPAADYARFFGETPVTQTRPTPAGQTPSPVATPRGAGSYYDSASLNCTWADPRADVSYISVALGSAPASELAAAQASAEADGYSCTTVDGGRSCQKVIPNENYPVDNTQTFFVRGTTWIRIGQTNVPTDNLLGTLLGSLDD